MNINILLYNNSLLSGFTKHYINEFDVSLRLFLEENEYIDFLVCLRILDEELKIYKSTPSMYNQKITDFEFYITKMISVLEILSPETTVSKKLVANLRQIASVI